MILNPGETIPLVLYTDDGSSDYFVLAKLFQRLPLESITTVILKATSIDGVYVNFDQVMPDTRFVDVIYEVYEPGGEVLLQVISEEIQKANQVSVNYQNSFASPVKGGILSYSSLIARLAESQSLVANVSSAKDQLSVSLSAKEDSVIGQVESASKTNLNVILK